MYDYLDLEKYFCNLKGHDIELNRNVNKIKKYMNAKIKTSIANKMQKKTNFNETNIFVQIVNNIQFN